MTIHSIHKNRGEIRLELNEYKNEHGERYGFMAYRTNGYSMPKGWITSMNAQCLLAEGDVETSAWIEYGIQSPTGDSSDHHHYTMPCANFEQAKAIVLEWYLAIDIMVDERQEQEVREQKKYLYS